LIPKSFLAIYACVACREEYEMVNCLVPYFYTHCEECDERRKFKSLRMEHKSWDWDAEDQL
jgi:predicted nucleic acid-binding Zn ribbon protein